MLSAGWRRFKVSSRRSEGAPTLDFVHAFRSQCEDPGSVKINVDDGSYVDLGIGNHGDAFRCDATGGEYRRVTADLSRFAGSTVRVLFQFSSSGENEASGWYIDDFSVRGILRPGAEFSIFPRRLAIVAFNASAPFRRGDSNDDGKVNVADPVHALGFLFLGGPAPRCLDAANSNDDGLVLINDPIFTLNALFLGTAELPPPIGLFCGPDPTPDGVEPLECGPSSTCEP
jgi:hypothetical protein